MKSLVEEKEIIEKESRISYTKQAEKVNIVSLMDANVKITGTVTKTEYVFAKAGTVVAVRKEDADEILNKKRGRACCGGTPGTLLFQLA